MSENLIGQEITISTKGKLRTILILDLKDGFYKAMDKNTKEKFEAIQEIYDKMFLIKHNKQIKPKNYKTPQSAIRNNTF